MDILFGGTPCIVLVFKFMYLVFKYISVMHLVFKCNKYV